MLKGRIACLCIVATIISGGVIFNNSVNAAQLSKNESVLEVKSKDTSNKEYNLSKDEIFYNMLNAIDNYNNISGKLNYYSKDIGINDEVSYDVKKKSDNENIIFKEECKDTNNGTIIKSESDGKTYNSLNLTTEEEISRDVIPLMQMTNDEKKKEARMYADDTGEMCYIYRQEISLLSNTSLSINPDMIAMGFMGDFNNWQIKGYEVLLNRKCAVIEGNINKYFNSKFSAEKFKAYIDAETGVLLKFNVIDSGGNVVESIETKEISIE